ncbi:unnamed protein product [Adineta ricciae]|uniref:Uncharacterized protein n=1 Tax=Adineta ricciae TaxID=249248 RepID=A0A814HID2_ADIRI|nr:unnamed protein product [Adineta ricciae]CAF1009844.1 unnamed protein product [Adineta ricciae]
MLDSARQIFVDCYNDRIQRFPSEQPNRITVAGNPSMNITITLHYPTGVILDVDHYMFITDCSNNRIVGSGPYGFRCIVGCSGTGGSTSS